MGRKGIEWGLEAVYYTVNFWLGSLPESQRKSKWGGTKADLACKIGGLGDIMGC